MSVFPRGLLRHGGRFLLAGGVQLALDWAVFVGLTAAGMPAAPANLVGRVAGALLGFVLHGRYTFADGAGEAAIASDAGRASPRGGRFLRYAVAWLSMTALSTWLVAGVAGQAGLHAAWWAKPLVEAGMAVLAFFVWRHWVFRRD